MAAVRVHRRHGRGLPGPVAPGHRGQRQLLQRERRGRHRPHAGARAAGPGRRARRRRRRVWPGRTATPWCSWAPAPRPTAPFPWTGHAGPPSAASTGAGRCRPSTWSATARVCAFVAGLVSAIVSGDHAAAAAQRRARRVVGRAGGGPGGDGGGRRHRLCGGHRRSRRAVHRAAVALRRGHHHARRAVRPGGDPGHPGVRPGTGRRGPFRAWGSWSTCRWRRCTRPTRGIWPICWGNREGAALCENGGTVKEACGVFGVYAPGRKVANLTFDGLFALAAPGPGVGRHGGQRRRHGHRGQGHGAGGHRLRRAQALGPAGAPGHRPHPLLDPRGVGLGRRPAGVPARSAGPASPSGTTAT